MHPVCVYVLQMLQWVLYNDVLMNLKVELVQ